MACPMPEDPPVTRTFLPFRPGMASLRSGVVTVSDIQVLLSLEVAPFVRAAAAALHPPPRCAERERRGAREERVGEPRAGEGAGELGGDVARDVPRRHPAPGPEAERHRRVEVRA